MGANPFLSTPTDVVTVEARQVYGNTLYYPTNEKAEAICKLTGQKTIRQQDAKHIRALGLRIITAGYAPQL